MDYIGCTQIFLAEPDEHGEKNDAGRDCPAVGFDKIIHPYYFVKVGIGFKPYRGKTDCNKCNKNYLPDFRVNIPGESFLSIIGILGLHFLGFFHQIALS